MAAVERLHVRAAHTHDGPWCVGHEPALANCCLVPRTSNALRIGCDLDQYSRSLAVFRHTLEHPAFIADEPTRQPDYVA
ncbi:protein of unknown function (plasmid) [Caballeronia sp. S22]